MLTHKQNALVAANQARLHGFTETSQALEQIALELDDASCGARVRDALDAATSTEEFFRALNALR